MKGWLDNYNDSKTSAPEGFQGDGYSNVGRNYSPAWGGQFQMGGKLNSSIPVIEDAGGYNEEGIWVPDWEAMTAQAKKLGAKKVKTKHGSLIVFDNNWEVIGVDDNPDAMQTGGSVYPVNYVPEAQDGYQMGTYFDEDARERNPNIMEETYDDYNTGMTGMMKSKMATQAALGNPGAKRMMSNMPAKYIFTGNERFSDGTPAEGAGAYGSHYISNRDNYVYPNLQDNGEGTLNFIPNASPSDREAMRFENPGEADYFANHYKEVAPMMKHYFNKLAMGGSIPGAVGFSYARTQGAAPSNGPYAKKTMASAQTGVRLDMYGAPITAIEVNDPSADRTSYDPRTNRMILGSDINAENRDKAIAHENYHASKYLDNMMNYDIAHHTDNEQWARMQAQPSMVSTNNVWSSYYDRKPREINDFINKAIDNSEFLKSYANTVSQGSPSAASGLVGDTVYDRVNVDKQLYLDPGTSEGEAQRYEDTGIRSYQNGGEMRYYQNGLDWKPKSISQGGIELPSVRSLINDTMNRKIQSKGKGKEVKTIQKDNTKTVTPKEIKKLSGIQQNRLAQQQSEQQAAKDYVQGSMEEAYKSPLMSPGYFTPEGAVIGAMQGATKMGPDLYEGNYKGVAIDALSMLPAVAEFAPEIRAGLKNIKTSLPAKDLETLHANGFFDFFKRKPKSDFPNYRLITDEDLPISSFNKASKEQIKSIGKKNIYNDLAKSESQRHQDLVRDIEEHGEAWKYTDQDIASSAKKANDAKIDWENYLDAQEANIKTNPEFFDNTTDDLVFYRGKGLGKEELQQLGEQQPDQWYGIQEYKGTRPNAQGYISDVDDYIGDSKYTLPGNRFDREAMLRDMGQDAINSFNKMYKNQNWKANISDIPLNKQGGVVKSNRGQWDYPGEVTEISGNTMATHGYGDIPLYVVPDKGDPRMVYPNTGTHTFPGASKFTEYPVAANGMETTTDETTIPIDRSFLDKLKNDTEARKKKVNIRETPNTIANDVIPNASKMATKGDEAIVKDVKYSNKIATEKAKSEAEAQKKFNALPKAEQERILYDQYNQQHGTISEYHPDSTLNKIGQSMFAPFTAMTDLYQKGEVRDNLLKSVINNPGSANPYDAAYLGTLGYAAAPSAIATASAIGAAAAPYATMIGNSLATDAVIGGNTIAGLNLGNAINAGFATHGAMNIIPDATKWLDRPSWENVESVGMDALELLPAVGPVSKTIGEGLNASGKFVGKGFEYAANKGSQALNKVGEFAAPRIEKTKTLLNDMGAVISGEAKTIGPKIDALNTAEDTLYRGPEYAQHSDEVAKLRNKKWNLEGRYNNLKSTATLSETKELSDRINKLQKRIDVAEQFKLNNEGLVQSGKSTALGLKTGSTDIMDLATGEKFPISTSVPSENIIHTLEGDKVVKTIDNTNLPQASPEYNSTVKKNIDFIENQIPGAKVFGSAKNVAEAEIPHIIGDYDVLMSQTQYDKFAKANPSVGNNGFAELHNIPGAAKGVDPIDINIIQEKGGKAIGTRAEELFKQMAPDEYYAAAKKAIKNKSEIKIPYSSQELVDMTNPTTKSVVDAYESSKGKHINKIDALINYGKPSVVAEGQQKFVNSLVGSKGSIGHQFPLEQLSNAETNKEMLDKINFIGNKALVAADPERMQIAINDYYMNNSILARQVDKGKINKIEAAIKEYYPGAKGGAVNGIGQNHVTLGFPNHGDAEILSMKQLGMDLNTTDPLSYINSIEHQVSGEKLFSQEERTILSDILKDIKMDDSYKYTANQSENTSQLIENLPYSEEGKQALYEFGKRTNRTMVKKDRNYGNSSFVATLRDFDEAIDAMQYQLIDQEYMHKSDRWLKSFDQRTQSAEYATRNQANISTDLELLPKQFKAIKGYVEGGIERANERLIELKKQRQNIYDDINDLSEKAYNKKYKDEIERLNQFKEKMNKEVADINQMRRDLYDRKVHLNKLGDNMKTVTILGGGSATLIGVGTYGYKKEMESRKEFNERLKKMTKEEREQFDKDLNERIRKKDSLERTDKPYTAKAMDWFMGRNQNGGNITKAKNGNELVKLNQLTNFTNYNTKQPGGWLDQY